MKSSLAEHIWLYIHFSWRLCWYLWIASFK